MTRVAEIKEALNNEKMQNAISSKLNGTQNTAEQIVEELIKQGLIKPEEVTTNDEEKPIITIGNNVIDVEKEIVYTGTNTGENPNPPAELPDITPTTPAGTQVKIPTNSNWNTTKVTAISDGSGHAIPLPNDFYYVGENYEEGLVISDKAGDTMDASGSTSGNQFVWIPANEATLTRTDFNTTTGQPTNSLSTSYTEPYESGYSDGKGTEEASEYNTMKTQIVKYGGFYIGKYEAGDGTNGTTPRTGVTTAHTVVSKKGVAPYNYVPWGKSMSDASEISERSGAVYLAKNFATQEGYTSVTSTLCYGCQWDAMCRYIGDANRTTPKKSKIELTGNVSTDVSKNIYDLAGNCREWTMEADNKNKMRIFRGGDWDYDGWIKFRNDTFPDQRCGT